MEAPKPKPHIQLYNSRYSKRVLLKTIFSDSDGGSAFIGQRVVIGGWVKSSKQTLLKKENVPPLLPPPVGGTAPQPPPPAQKDVTCVEMFQSKFPLFRSIMRVFGSNQPLREKVESIKEASTSVVYLQVSDGSCVDNLLVCTENYFPSYSLRLECMLWLIFQNYAIYQYPTPSIFELSSAPPSILADNGENVIHPAISLARSIEPHDPGLTCSDSVDRTFFTPRPKIDFQKTNNLQIEPYPHLYSGFGLNLDWSVSRSSSFLTRSMLNGSISTFTQKRKFFNKICNIKTMW